MATVAIGFVNWPCKPGFPSQSSRDSLIFSNEGGGKESNLSITLTKHILTK